MLPLHKCVCVCVWGGGGGRGDSQNKDRMRNFNLRFKKILTRYIKIIRRIKPHVKYD